MNSHPVYLFELWSHSCVCVCVCVSIEKKIAKPCKVFMAQLHSNVEEEVHLEDFHCHFQLFLNKRIMQLDSFCQDA